MLAGPCASAATNTLQGNICIIDSYGREIAPFNITERVARDTILEAWGTTAVTELQVFSLDDARYANAKRHERYAGALEESVPKPVVLVAAIGETAARFSSKYRARLFPDATIVFVADAAGLAADGIVRTNDVVIPLANTPSGAVENVLAVLPETTNIAVVIGNSDLEKKWLKKCRATFDPFTNRVGFTYLNKEGLKTITNIVAKLPPHSAVLYMMMINDGAGRVYDYDETLGVLRQAANAPVFGCFESQMGAGIVGGRLIQNRAAGLAAGDAVVRLYRGEKPANIVAPPLTSGPPVYDERELRRWGISERSLPPGSRVEFRGPGIWQQYRMHVVVSLAVIMMQSALIALLLMNRRKLRRSRAKLQEREQLSAVAERAAKLGFWVWDIAKDTVWASDNCRQIFGLGAKQPLAIGVLLSVVHPEDRARRQALLDEALKKAGEYDVEYRIVLADGTVRWIGSRGLALADGNGKAVRLCGVSMDITEHKRAEAELAQQRDELAHLSRVTTVSALSGSLAHELNQPLGIILSNTQAAQELLLQNPPALTDLGEILADIVAADRRAAEIIQRLRDLLKRGETSMQPLPINKVLEDVLHLTRSDLIGRGIIATCDFAPDLPPVTGTRVQIQQVALNLILNAADAMAGNAPGSRRLFLTTARHGDVVRVTIRDEGTGLPEDTERLFDAFYTTKPTGLGMGLAICRSIIFAHHGRIWAEPHPERGAIFHFELPVAAASVSP